MNVKVTVMDMIRNRDKEKCGNKRSLLGREASEYSYMVCTYEEDSKTKCTGRRWVGIGGSTDQKHQN